MVLEWLKGATGVFSAGDRGAARSPAQARPPARRVRIQEDAKAAAAARVTREKEKARKDTPRKKNQSRAPSSRLKDDFVVDKKVLGEGHYGVVRRCSPRADPSAPARKSQKQHLFKSNRGVGGRRRRTIGNRKSLLGAVRVRCDVAHQTALERRPPRHPSSPLHAATAASAKDASRDRRLAQPPRTCPDSDACSSRASVTGSN